MLQLSTNLRNVMLASGSLKSEMDGAVIQIYAGVQPASADAALTVDNVLLCTVSLNGGATGGSLAAPALNGVIQKNPNEVWTGNVVVSGTATWFRMVKPADTNALSLTDSRIQGSIAVAGGDAYLASTSLVAGNPVSLSYFSLALPTY